ncbi:MAG: peptide-binding protein [Deferribacteraceae bacterium]|jgi:peptide/nickel transport system substrate-binding protein|nr:peptide-binding protein [Deferribacteraceae bacterium]
MRGLYSLLLICAVILSVFCGCKKTQVLSDDDAAGDRKSAAGKNRAKNPYGDMLVIASIGEPLNLIPAIAHDSASHEAANLIYDGLITIDKDKNIKGALAESWDVSPTDTSITFYLRKDVTWHDGAPFTSKDVIFTYKFMLDNNTPTSYDADFRKITSIDAPDDYTVVVEYEEPYAPALISWSIWIMPAHLLEGQLPAKSPLQRSPVGTGPYIFESWNANQNLTLKSNPAYYEGQPYVEKVMFRYLQDQGASFLELLQGGVDFMQLTAAQYEKQTDTERFRTFYNKYNYLADSYSYIGYNLTRKPFDDKLVRQALSYATPRQEIIDSILHGHGVSATGPYKPGTYWHNPNVQSYATDLKKARELLNASGWELNEKGLLMKDKKAFRIELITNQNTTRIQIAEILQKSWKELGIEVDIRVAEWGAFISQHIDKRNFDAVILSWNIVLDPDPNDVWNSSSCADKKTLNFMCFKNEEADRLMSEGTSTFDPVKRKACYDRFQEILAEEQPYTFLFVPESLSAVSKRFEGVEPAPAGLLYNLIDWYVPTGVQKYKIQR